MRIVQLQHPQLGRHVALVEDGRLRLLRTFRTAYAAASEAATSGRRLTEVIGADAGDILLDYEAIYAGKTNRRLLPPFDYPGEPRRTLVSGTGLTHRKSAQSRDAMHQLDPLALDAAPPAANEGVTDSMRMYQMGEEGGKPFPGQVGTAPEWFYKGNGSILRAHGMPLEVPAHAEDGGEEAEVAGIYVIDPNGVPRRVGFAAGNEFSDHALERRNYLYLAPSKLRACAIGPELAIDARFDDLQGEARVERGGLTVWSAPIATGEANMVHSLANIEHHHFKHAAHRRPGDVHVHFFGAGAMSCADGVTLEEGDVMVVDIPALGRPLRNPLMIERASVPLLAAEPLL